MLRLRAARARTVFRGVFQNFPDSESKITVFAQILDAQVPLAILAQVRFPTRTQSRCRFIKHLARRSPFMPLLLNDVPRSIGRLCSSRVRQKKPLKKPCNYGLLGAAAPSLRFPACGSQALSRKRSSALDTCDVLVICPCTLRLPVIE